MERVKERCRRKSGRRIYLSQSSLAGNCPLVGLVASTKGTRILIPKGEEKRFLDNFVGECFSPCPGFDSDVVFEIFLLVPSIELIFMYSSSAA